MLNNLLTLLFFAAILGQIKRGRSLVLMVSSVLIIYWLQPQTEPHNFTFWIPTFTLFIIVVTWFITAPPDTRNAKKNRLALLVLLATIFAIIFTRYSDFFQPLAFYPPRPLVFFLTIFLLFIILFLVSKTPKLARFWQVGMLIAILFIFILIRVPNLLPLLTTWGATLLNRTLETSPRIQWFGYSYIAFRLIHTIRDKQANRLPSVSLDEYMSYVIFFPALSAGPIDRIQRFLPELRQPKKLESDDWVLISKRVFLGLFKKFIIADTLAIIAMNAGLVQNVQTQAWMWVTVYAYAFQIYFDFSGYTDIAIGMGRLLGIELPENFRNPYLKPNLAQFWNNWHITLTQWFRAYYFNPLTRVLRKKNLPTWITLATVQLSTMILIGFWHGITWNFFLWGLWHGVGLFVHNRWSNWMRQKTQMNSLSAFQQKIRSGISILLTFNFVAIGWVFFALPTPTLARETLFMLFGLTQ